MGAIESSPLSEAMPVIPAFAPFLTWSLAEARATLLDYQDRNLDFAVEV